MPVRVPAPLVCLCALALAVPASADVPDPVHCTVDSRLVASPDGASTFVVSLRDAANVPIPGATALLDFNGMSGVALCTSVDPDRDGRIVAMTDASGIARFVVRGGGRASGPVPVRTRDFDVGTTTFVSMDLDGDLDVDTVDRDQLVALYGTTGPTGDLNGDNTVSEADRTLLEGHLGGVCGEDDTPPPPPPPPPPTPDPPVTVSWGGLKSRYR